MGGDGTESQADERSKEAQRTASKTSRRALLAAGFAISAGCLRLSEDQQSAGGNSTRSGDGGTTQNNGGNSTQTGDGGATQNDDSGGGGDEIDSRVQVVGNVGTVDEDGREVIAIRLTVQRAAESGSIDLSELTIQYTSSGGSETLVHASRGVPGFYLSPIVAADDSNAVLSDAGDRYSVVAPLVSDEFVSELAGEDPVDETPRVENAALEPLGEGTTATLALTTASGATTVVNVAVPDTLAQSAGGAVQL
ncbi:hypothetical protein [Halovenus halobia]|uniref:hypothetical protein n=1 Tax=Halovenus halobia TaxID=3396622 RepID=UPI003F54E623